MPPNSPPHTAPEEAPRPGSCRPGWFGPGSHNPASFGTAPGKLGSLLSRRAALLLPLAAASCADDEAPRSFAPLRYDYLLPLSLDVGSVEIDDQWRPTNPADLGTFAPVRPKDALIAMAEDRLKIGGSTGKAIYTIDDASLAQSGDNLVGTFAVHLDILDGTNNRVGYAEARVVRTRNGPSRRSALPGVLYDFTRQMTDAMNVEFEYQIRQRLPQFLTQPVSRDPTPGPIPGPVQQQSLPTPVPAPP